MRKGWAALHAEGRSKIWEAANFAEVLADRDSHTGTAASVSTWLARRAPELRQLQLVDCSCDSAAAVHHSGRPQVSCFVVAVAEIKPDYKFRCNHMFRRLCRTVRCIAPGMWRRSGVSFCGLLQGVRKHQPESLD